MNKKPLVLAVSLALTMLVTHPAQALTATWIGTDGWWNDGANWSSGLQPQNVDGVSLTQSDAINRTVNYWNTAYPSAVLSSLVIDATGSGTMTLFQTKDALSVSGLALIGGNGSGTLTQSGGTNTVSGSNYGNGLNALSLGLASGSSGTYNLSGTGSLSATGVTVGFGGTGIFNQSGGTHTVGGDIYLGWNGGSSGTYNLSAGSLAANNMLVGYQGSGIVNQSGGTNTLSGALVMINSASNYNLQGGTLNVGSIVGSGTLNLDGGALTVGGGNGTIDVGTLVLGKGAGSNVNYTLSTTGFYNGGSKVASALTASNLTLGDSGTGTFTQSGGTFTVAGTLSLGSNSGGNGTYNLDGGTLNVGSIVHGSGGGSFNWTAGALNVTGTFNIGSSNPLGQTFVLDASKDFSAANMSINAGATFIHASGTHTISNQMAVNGTSSLDGGTLNVGSIGGSGKLNLNGGALSVGGGNGTINVGTLVLGQAAGSNVNYALSTTGFFNGANKVANALTAGNLTLGESGTSTFNMVGGSIYGASKLTQNAASKLTGFGIIYADDVSNAGTINAKSGNLVLSGNTFSNTGLIKNSVGSNLFIGAATVTHQGNIEVNAAGSVVFDAEITNVAGKSVKLLGGALATPTLVNQAGGSITGFGTLAGNLTNAGSVEFYGPTNIIGDVTNQSGATILVRNDQTLITGHTVNDGTIMTLQGKVVFEGGLTNNGAYLSDPSENYFTDLIVNQSGYLVGEAGDKFLVSGSFENYSLQDTQWNTRAANLTLTGVSLQNMYLAGDDLGALMSGYANNFAWGEFSLVAGSSVKLWDSNGDPGAALYVGLVELGGGLGQLSSIDSAYNIYYDASLAGNAYLGGQSYTLNGGGYLMAAQPVPEASTYAMMLAGLGLVGLMARRRKQAAI